MKRFCLQFLLPPLVLSSCNAFIPTSGKHHHDNSSIVDHTISEIRKTQKVYAFELNPSDKSGHRDVICSYPVTRNLGNLGEQYACIIGFLLSDSLALEKNYTPVRQPFYPTIALKPDKNKSLACLLSFGTEEIAFSCDDSTYITFRINDMRSFRRLCDRILE